MSVARSVCMCIQPSVFCERFLTFELAASAERPSSLGLPPSSGVVLDQLPAALRRRIRR